MGKRLISVEEALRHADLLDRYKTNEFTVKVIRDLCEQLKVGTVPPTPIIERQLPNTGTVTLGLEPENDDADGEQAQDD